MPVMSSVPLAGDGPAFYLCAAMTGGSGKSGDPKRGERLRAALRENLRRRKAQARGRKSAPESPQTPAAPGDKRR